MGRVIWLAVSAAAIALLTWMLAFGIPSALSAADAPARIVQARVDGRGVEWWAHRARANGATMRALQSALHDRVAVDSSGWLANAFLCIQRRETAPPYPDWRTASGNGFFGGLQMNLGFQRSYGAEFLAAWGTADHWPAFVQVTVAMRAYLAGRRFDPWPNTARDCGLR